MGRVAFWRELGDFYLLTKTGLPELLFNDGERPDIIDCWFDPLMKMTFPCDFEPESGGSTVLRQKVKIILRVVLNPLGMRNGKERRAMGRKEGVDGFQILDAHLVRGPVRPDSNTHHGVEAALRKGREIIC